MRQRRPGKGARPAPSAEWEGTLSGQNNLSEVDGIHVSSLLSIVAVGLFLVVAPLLLVRFLPPGGKGRQVRLALQILAPVATVLPIVIGFLQYVGTQQIQAASESRSEYIRATQLLVEPEVSKQMAGIAAVAQLAAGDGEKTWLMTESLSSFVRLSARRDIATAVHDRGIHPRAPAKDPPCSPDAPVEFKYNYSTCGQVSPLYYRSPAVQAAITALATRNKDLEDVANPPLRFIRLVQRHKTNFWAELWDNLRGEGPRSVVIRYIELNWSMHNPPRVESNEQLIAESSVARAAEYPEIAVRLWLDLSRSDLTGIQADSGWLEGGNFAGSILNFGTLANARLGRTNFSDAWLVGAKLFGADLRGADMQFADVRGADLGEVDLTKAWVSG